MSSSGHRGNRAKIRGDVACNVSDARRNIKKRPEKDARADERPVKAGTRHSGGSAVDTMLDDYPLRNRCRSTGQEWNSGRAGTASTAALRSAAWNERTCPKPRHTVSKSRRQTREQPRIRIGREQPVKPCKQPSKQAQNRSRRTRKGREEDPRLLNSLSGRAGRAVRCAIDVGRLAGLAGQTERRKARSTRK